jgi:hypothetical protein
MCILLVSVLLLSGPIPAAHAAPSSFNPSSSGAKALFLLLQDLGYRTERVFGLGDLSAGTDAAILLGPEHGLDARAHTLILERSHHVLLAPPLHGEEALCQDFRLGPITIHRRWIAEGSGSSLQQSDLRLQASACVLKAPAGARVLAGTSDAALAFEVPAGRGSVLVVASDLMVVNGSLRQDDIAVLVRRWFAQRVPAHGRVVFVEEREGGQLLDLARRAHLLPFLLHGVLWLILLYWAVAPRFGDPAPAPPSTRRAFAQHARALGQLYQHRGASARALKHQYERFLERLLGRVERRGPTPHGTPSILDRERRRTRAALATRVATRSGDDPARIESLLAQVEYAAAAARVVGEEGADAKEIQRHFRLSQALAALQRGTAEKRGGKRGLSRIR